MRALHSEARRSFKSDGALAARLDDLIVEQARTNYLRFWLSTRRGNAPQGQP
jgi:hypothetical protein